MCINLFRFDCVCVQRMRNVRNWRQTWSDKNSDGLRKSRMKCKDNSTNERACFCFSLWFGWTRQYVEVSWEFRPLMGYVWNPFKRKWRSNSFNSCYRVRSIDKVNFKYADVISYHSRVIFHAYAFRWFLDKVPNYFHHIFSSSECLWYSFFHFVQSNPELFFLFSPHSALKLMFHACMISYIWHKAHDAK